MPEPIGVQALTPNPALQPFAVLIGEWRTSGSHPYFPDTEFRGRATFSWHEGGAFLLFRSENDHPRVPSGVAVLGSDHEVFQLLYFDERGESRRYDVTMVGDRMTWRRSSSVLAQRMVFEIDPTGTTIVCTGEMSRDDGPWEGDLSLTYRRIG